MHPADARRIKRRIKASLALGIGIVAGAFLACSRAVQQEKAITIEPLPPNPTTPPTSSIVLAQHTRDAAVDHDEHRKGMPVPDNLLE